MPFCPVVDRAKFWVRKVAGPSALCLSVVLTGCLSEAPPEPESRSNAKLAPASSSDATGADGSSEVEGAGRKHIDSPTQSGAQAILASGLEHRAHEDLAQLEASQSHVHRMKVRPDLSPEARQELRQSIARRLRRTTDDLEHFQVGTLGEAVSTRERFQHVVVQVRDEQGNLSTECLENESQLDALLRARGEQ